MAGLLSFVYKFLDRPTSSLAQTKELDTHAEALDRIYDSCAAGNFRLARPQTQGERDFRTAWKRIFRSDEDATGADVASEENLILTRAFTANVGDQLRPAVLAFFDLGSGVRPFLLLHPGTPHRLGLIYPPASS